MIIAMDGTAASGKSTIARALAENLRWNYLNSGALYRAWAHFFLEKSVEPEEEAVRPYLGTHSGPLLMLQSRVFGVGLGERILDGELVEESVNRAVASYARIPSLRALVTGSLRSAVEGMNAVVEGRDIGTAVFPDAALKFFLDADPEIRRKRRSAQGFQDEISARDREDSTRSCAPLAIPADAIRVDTGYLAPNEIVGMMLDVVRERLSSAATLKS